MNPVNSLTILKTNKSLTLNEAGSEIVQATVLQRIYRFISRSYANEVDKKVAEFALSQFALLGEEDKAQALTHIDHFSKLKSRSIVPIRQMQNLATAEKMKKALPFLANRNLLTEQREETALLTLIRKNFLHKVLPVVDQEHAHSAIIEDREGKLYIRSPLGENFLNDHEKITSIMRSFGEYGTLSNEQKQEYGLLQQILEMNGSDHNIAAFLKGHYSYVPLDSVASENGELNGAYWADGVQGHDSWNFTELRPSIVRSKMPEFGEADYEIEKRPQYEIRLITRKPDYSRVGSTLWEFVSSLPSVSKHGHSYLELVEYEMEGGEYTGRELVYNVGYFLRGRLTSNDHTSFVPPSRGGIARERFIVDERQFTQAKQMIEGIQTIMLKPGHNTRSELPQDYDVENSMRSTINHVYKTVKKGTCLTFASIVLEEATRSNMDRRDSVRKYLFPRENYAFLDTVGKVFSYIPLVNYLYHGISLLNRGEIPAYAVRSGDDRILDVRSTGDTQQPGEKDLLRC